MLFPAVYNLPPVFIANVLSLSSTQQTCLSKKEVVSLPGSEHTLFYIHISLQAPPAFIVKIFSIKYLLQKQRRTVLTGKFILFMLADWSSLYQNLSRNKVLTNHSAGSNR